MSTNPQYQGDADSIVGLAWTCVRAQTKKAMLVKKLGDDQMRWTK